MKMKRGVFASCLPRQAPCATIRVRTAGTANDLILKYEVPAVTIALFAPMIRKRDGAVTCTSALTVTPMPKARPSAVPSVLLAQFFFPSARFFAMSPVVPVERKLNIWNTKLKMDVFGPSAARLSVLARPTQAVSMRDMSGSARSDPKAGSASASISCVSLAFQNLWTGNGGLTLGPLDSISPLFLSLRSTGTVPSSFPPLSSLLEGTILAHRTGHVRLHLVLGHLFHVRGVVVVRRALRSIVAIPRSTVGFPGGSLPPLCASRFLSSPSLPAKTEGKTKECDPEGIEINGKIAMDGRMVAMGMDRSGREYRPAPHPVEIPQGRGWKRDAPLSPTLSRGLLRHKQGTSGVVGAGWSSPHPIT